MTKVKVKDGQIWLEGTWTKKEIKSYLSGRLPKMVKVPVGDRFEGFQGLMRVLGYKLQEILRSNPRSRQFYAIFRLN